MTIQELINVLSALPVAVRRKQGVYVWDYEFAKYYRINGVTVADLTDPVTEHNQMNIYVEY